MRHVSLHRQNEILATPLIIVCKPCTTKTVTAVGLFTSASEVMFWLGLFVCSLAVGLSVSTLIAGTIFTLF